MAELDLLRFFAASAVVFYHLTYIKTPGIVDENAFGAVPAVTRFGYLGVNLFFMISGFVILWSSQGRTAVQFVISRVARLYPSFWICVLLSALVVNWGNPGELSLRTVATNLTMIPGAVGVPFVDGVYWTLFVELKFYFLIFVLLVTGNMKHVERWLLVWLAASVVSALGIAPSWLKSLVMYPYGPYFISGCLLYLIRSRGLTALRGTALVISAALAVNHAIGQQPAFMSSVTTTSSIVVVSVIIAFHVILTMIAIVPKILPDSRWWFALGMLTYPLYLLHNRIGKAVFYGTYQEHSAPWFSLGIALVCAYGVASIIATLVEQRVCGALNRAMMQSLVRVQTRFSTAT